MPPLSAGSLLRCTVNWCRHNILLPITIFFMLGTFTGRLEPVLISDNLLFTAIALLAGAIIFLFLSGKKKQTTALLLCVPLFFLIGFSNIRNHVKTAAAAGQLQTLFNEQHQVTLVGTLITMVETGQVEVKNRKRGIRSHFEVNVRQILLHGNQRDWLPVHGRIRLAMRGSSNDLQPGMELMILAKAGRVSNFKTPGAFDYTNNLAARNIHISGWIRDRRDIVVLKQLPGQSTLTQLVFLPEQIRSRVAEFLNKSLPAQVSGTYQALLVGSRAAVSRTIQEQFKATGTMHLLAISGLHMGLLALMIGSILNWLLKRSQWLLLHCYVPGLALLGTMPILLGYGFIAGMNTPVLRALIMAAIMLSAVLLRRQHNLLHLVAAAALLVLSLHPLALFTPSFQLSFSAVTALALFFPLLAKTMKKRDDNRHRLAFFLYRSIKTGLLISIIASLGTLPFMLLHFNRFSTIGPLMNLIVEPFLCFWALPWGLAAIPFIFVAPQVAVLFLKIGGLGITAGHYCTALGAALPFASIWTITPTLPEIAAYIVLFLLWQLRPFHGIIKLVIPCGLLLLIIHFTWGIRFPVKQSCSQVSYLEVGQGSSTFLLLADGTRVLFDGGGSRNSSMNVGERIIAPYLWQQRIWRLDLAIISHPHSDHFNGMDFILRHFRPKKLYINGDTRYEGKYGQVIDQARQQGIDIIIGQAGQIIRQGDQYILTFLGMAGLPDMEEGSVNDRSLVLLYRHGRRSFLFPADISQKSEKLLLKEYPELAADVLLACHHGSATASSKPFIAAVRPQLIVVSAGKFGKEHYPFPANLAYWQHQHIPVRITRNQGTITCTTDGNFLSCSDYASPYRISGPVNILANGTE